MKTYKVIYQRPDGTQSAVFISTTQGAKAAQIEAEEDFCMDEYGMKVLKVEESK